MNHTIFISVAAYCDSLLTQTVMDAFSKAKYPKNLYFGIVEQADEKLMKGDPNVKNIRYVGINKSDSRGCCWARSVAMSLYHGEDYFLQIDSHMLFDQDWDVKMIKMAKECEAFNKKFLISSYPHPFEFENGMNVKKPVTDKVVGHIVNPDIPFGEEDRFLTFKGVDIDTYGPMRGYHIAAGCLFAPGSFVNDVPYDPMFYFNGEEHSLSLRAFTHGYDLFHTAGIPIYHLYDSENNPRPKHWSEDEDKERAQRWWDLHNVAVKRFDDLITGKLSGIYGLGSERTVEDFKNFSGIDYVNKTLDQKATVGYWITEAV